jgi:hypothetical protein
MGVNISVLILCRKSLQARHFRNFYVLFTSSPNPDTADIHRNSDVLYTRACDYPK